MFFFSSLIHCYEIKMIDIVLMILTITIKVKINFIIIIIILLISYKCNIGYKYLKS